MTRLTFITGITGQDGSYLAEQLLEKGYKVHGFSRRSSNHQNLARIEHILPDIQLHTGDMTDSASLRNTLTSIWDSEKYDRFEIYNLAAQSHVHQSFSMPEYTAQVDALAPLYILEWMRAQKGVEKIRFYQASTSELYGKVAESPQNEDTPFYPRSPYSVAKLYAYWIVRNYRESYNLFAVNGILFNHESPRRGQDFVTRKITLAISDLYHGRKEVLEIGNLDAKRDWGHARDYVEGMWRIMQQNIPEDFVLGTGEQHTVREFMELAYEVAFPGHRLTWTGSGINEKGYDGERLRVQINPDFFRPAEVQTLLANTEKAQRMLGWSSSTSFPALVKEMIAEDLKN
jgi:GDPmannose 4,6-dehydratase